MRNNSYTNFLKDNLDKYAIIKKNIQPRTRSTSIKKNNKSKFKWLS